MIDSLIEVLQANNQRLESLYNKYFKFKEKQIKKETVLKEKLTSEQKSYKELELKFESYKKEVSLNNFPLVSIDTAIHNIIKDEKLALIRVLQSLENQMMKMLKEQNEAYIRKLDVMTVLHLQEIDQINYAMQEKNNLICSLNLNIENLNATIQKMNIDLGSIPTFNLQINTYENTVKAERATVEILSEELFNVNHCLEECNTENFKLKKEISNLTQNSLSDIQQFCNTPSTMCEFDDFDISSFKDRPKQSRPEDLSKSFSQEKFKT